MRTPTLRPIRLDPYVFLAALILLPCAVQTSAQAAPLTEQDTVVLGGFDNQTADTAFDGALRQALAIEFGQSPFLNVLSDRKVSEALRAMGRAMDAPITTALARDICRRSDSAAVIDGAISKPGAAYRLELTAIACDSGATLAEAQGDAAAEGDVLNSLSQVSAALRAKLGEPAASVREYSVPIEAVTRSLGALKDYSIGQTLRRVSGDNPSIAPFKQAIGLDPDFPLPYSQLAAIYNNLRQPSLAQRYASDAYRLRDQATARDALQIAGVYFLVSGDLQKEAVNYRLWEQQYPWDFTPYNNLGNDYAQEGLLEKALVEYQHALLLVPSVITYTNVTGMQISLDRLDAAQATLDEAAARKVDGLYLHQSQYWVSFLRGDAARMQQQVDWAMGKPDEEDVLLSMESDTAAYYGQLARARDYTRQAVDSAVHSGSTEAAALWQVNAALRAAELGDVPAATQGVKQALALSAGRDVTLIAAFTLARSGESAQAGALVTKLEKDYPTDSLMKLYWLPTIEAAIASDQGDAGAALKHLDATRPYELGAAGTFVSYLYPAYMRGLAYLQLHDGADAAAEFQKLPAHAGVVTNFLTGALAHLQLGRAYAMAGDTAKAKAAYQAFFAVWKDADPGTPLLQQAKAEYAKLQ